MRREKTNSDRKRKIISWVIGYGIYSVIFFHCAVCCFFIIRTNIILSLDFCASFHLCTFLFFLLASLCCLFVVTCYRVSVVSFGACTIRLICEKVSINIHTSREIHKHVRCFFFCRFQKEIYVDCSWYFVFFVLCC